MKNLSLKERCLLIGVGLALFVAIAYVFVIMPLNEKIQTRTAELKERVELDEQYKAIQASNYELKNSIAETEKKIIAIEKKFLPDVDVDVIENYILQVFDKENQHYLSSVSSEDVAAPLVYLPDGSIAREELKIKRVTVVYATTDGYTIPEYDMNPNWRLPTGTLNEELIASQIAMMGNYKIEGYNEFIAGCKKVAETFPDTNCVKIHKITVEDSDTGFLYLTAEIDIYSAELGASRLTEVTDPGQINLTWSGETNVNTKGGMIGMPLVNMNEDNSFYLTGIALKKLTEFDDRPFASYFSNAILTMIAKSELPLYEDYVNKVSTASTAYAFNADEATDIIDTTTEE